ncbi:carboxypeptidase-like regulatory domain-containing protein [Allomuricauda sp. d1]|uniref:carboxypeptidase-like regulatory domain-containing protein n=1 Tax=Allomuricauda sp. d1 TaxID=3136725 RepID=UPI0031D7DECD
MKRIAPLLLLVISPLFLIGQNTKIIKGTVTDGKHPLADVSVSNLSSNQIYITDARGNYTAEAKVGDYLLYSFNGMKDVQIKIEDVTRTLNVTLYPEANMLDEVVVEGNRTSQEYLEKQYVENKNIIKTAYGYLDRKKSAANIRVLDMEENNYTYVCIVELLRARFPELTVFGSCADSSVSVFFRGQGSINNPQPIIFDVDGQLFTETPVQLDMNGIKRIALIRDLATRVRYGAKGAGGVMVINTYYPVPNDSEESTNGLEQVAQKARLLPNTSVVNAEPTYLKSMKNSASMEAAKEVFGIFQDSYSSSPFFYLDAYTFFYERGEKDFADQLIQNNHSRLFENNAVLLKALAYLYQEQERHEKANEALKQVFVLRPNYAQSYLDIARSFRDLGKPKLSATMYARYDFLLQEQFLERDSIGFDPILEQEVKNLMALNKTQFADNKNVSNIPKPTDASGVTRLVFEWNDSEAEFDLEFLKGSEQHYVYNHTYEESSEDILREKNHGYSIAEYLIDNSSGYKPWQVNINYLGNKSLTPTYLKVTTYNNYGSRSQNKSVKVFKLTTKNVNQELLTL